MRGIPALLMGIGCLSTTVIAWSQEITIPRVPTTIADTDLSNLPGDLRAAPVPEPSNLGDFVKDRRVALILGKALFWDMQLGSDGVQACASCHFRAGADPRSKNQVNPGTRHMPAPDLSYQTAGAANGQLNANDFPLTKLAIPGTRGTLDAGFDSNDVISSQGIHFLGAGDDPLGFSVGGLKTRRVEPRNTPSVINSVFNHRQFWDGRASNLFNGVNHVGDRDTNAKVFRADDPRNPYEVRIKLEHASLASQAVAPIISDVEMSAPGRTVQEVGRELASGPRKIFRRIQNLRPLAKQKVHPEDSVLGPMSRWPQPGLAVGNYDTLIKKAFHERWWQSSRLIRVYPDRPPRVVDQDDGDTGTTEHTLIQYNFALFLGLAVQIYESTLISDDTPWDRFRRAHPLKTDTALNPWINVNPEHISRLALFGAHLFNDRTRGTTNIRCSNCHEQAELTDASVRRITTPPNGPIRNRDGNIIDRGFNNIGIRPTSDDLGVGASDVFGPLSFSRTTFPNGPPAKFEGADVTKGFGVEGAFKVPSLRNVALTAPYFHNGDARTLREVVELYSRGGNVAPVRQLDNTLIEPLGIPVLSSDEIDALVAFLEALTDERVLYRRAPFDQPQLFVPNGHPGDSEATQDTNGDGRADDLFVEISAVGRNGGAPIAGFCRAHSDHEAPNIMVAVAGSG